MITQPIFKDFVLLIKPKDEEDAEVGVFSFTPFTLLAGLSHPEAKEEDTEDIVAATLVGMLTELNKKFDFYTGEYE